MPLIKFEWRDTFIEPLVAIYKLIEMKKISDIYFFKVVFQENVSEKPYEVYTKHIISAFKYTYSFTILRFSWPKLILNSAHFGSHHVKLSFTLVTNISVVVQRAIPSGFSDCLRSTTENAARPKYL